MHIGCFNHRLEVITDIVFSGSGVKKTMVLAQALVTRYSTSSHMEDRLDRYVSHGNAPEYLESHPRHGDKVVDDLCHGRPPSLPGNAIELHAQVDKLWHSAYAKPVVKSFMTAQKLLEGEK